MHITKGIFFLPPLLSLLLLFQCGFQLYSFLKQFPLITHRAKNWVLIFLGGLTLYFFLSFLGKIGGEKFLGEGAILQLRIGLGALLGLAYFSLGSFFLDLLHSEGDNNSNKGKGFVRSLQKIPLFGLFIGMTFEKFGYTELIWGCLFVLYLATLFALSKKRDYFRLPWRNLVFSSFFLLFMTLFLFIGQRTEISSTSWGALIFWIPGVFWFLKNLFLFFCLNFFLVRLYVNERLSNP